VLHSLSILQTWIPGPWGIHLAPMSHSQWTYATHAHYPLYAEPVFRLKLLFLRWQLSTAGGARALRNAEHRDTSLFP
jgi:hypothetical protein